MVTIESKPAEGASAAQPPVDAKPVSASGGAPGQGLKLTERAIKRIRVAMAKEGVSPTEGGLRLGVMGGGCSGLQYGFEFDEQVQDGDTCVENQGVKLLVDPMSFQYLGGAEIDYREGLDGAQFVIRNPSAKTTCGCGSSFSA